jgi:pantothenate kinase-related protein Tda10
MPVWLNLLTKIPGWVEEGKRPEIRSITASKGSGSNLAQGIQGFK